MVMEWPTPNQQVETISRDFYLYLDVEDRWEGVMFGKLCAIGLDHRSENTFLQRQVSVGEARSALFVDQNAPIFEPVSHRTHRRCTC